MNAFDFRGKTAVVIGGGGELCGCFAKELAKHGAQVAILSLHKENAQKTADAIIAEGGKAIAVQCDVTDKESLIRAEAEVYEQLGEYHILVNGAAGSVPGGTTTHEYYSEEDEKNPDVYSFFDLPEEKLHKVMNIVWFGTLYACQVFLKRMIKLPSCTVLNVASMGAYTPLQRSLVYSTAKAGVINLSQWLAVHFGAQHVRVNAVAPGFFITKLNRHVLTNADGTYSRRSNNIIGHTPMGRLGNPEDLLGTMLYLCDENLSGYVNGVCVPVDGGFLVHPGI